MRERSAYENMFAMDLRTLRLQRGLSVAQLADILGMSSRGRLSEMEHHKKPIPVHLALKIEAWSGGEIRAADINRSVAVVDRARAA